MSAANAKLQVMPNLASACLALIEGHAPALESLALADWKMACSMAPLGDVLAATAALPRLASLELDGCHPDGFVAVMDGLRRRGALRRL